MGRQHSPRLDSLTHAPFMAPIPLSDSDLRDAVGKDFRQGITGSYSDLNVDVPHHEDHPLLRPTHAYRDAVLPRGKGTDTFLPLSTAKSVAGGIKEYPQ